MPVVGVTLISGNNLGGGKVIISLCVIHTVISQEELGSGEEIYPACAVTRAMARKKIEDDTNDQINLRYVRNLTRHQ